MISKLHTRGWPVGVHGVVVEIRSVEVSVDFRSDRRLQISQPKSLPVETIEPPGNIHRNGYRYKIPTLMKPN